MNREQGFSIAELLVVVFIMGVVFAIAVPAFTLQRKNANDKNVEADVMAANATIETWILRHPAQKIPNGTISRNPDGTVSVPANLMNAGLRNFKASEGTTLVITGHTKPMGTYEIVARNDSGNRAASSIGLVYDSSEGGFQN